MPTALTEGVRVTVESRYLEEHSQPEESRYAFAYFVSIANEGDARVQLRRRHWIITDGNGRVEEVEGPGVVGQQPILDHGEVHRYSSGCVLPTPVGTMEGTYEMHEAGGRVFRAEIPRFALHVPGALQ
jgi:ApaG protein